MIDDITRARTLAVVAHGDQCYGNRPYVVHLQAVVDVLIRFGTAADDPQSAPLIVAAWLHDTLEDTALTRVDLAEQFDNAVAELVWRVSDEPGPNRRARKAATYNKIAACNSAIALKLADRIANVEASLADANSRYTMYRREYVEFRLALFRPSPPPMIAQMWEHLEGLFEQSDLHS